MTTLWVAYEGVRYPVVVRAGLFQELGRELDALGVDRARPLFVLSDEAVGALYGARVEAALRSAGYAVARYDVPAGERSKSLATLEAVTGAMLRAGIDRRGVLLALGGGVVGDLGGFAAAVYMRGIEYVQLPTTILAHDASVGGKVAVNHPLAKNILGAFYPPLAVLYDVAALRTLPPREVRSGYAELIKHALLSDAAFVAWLHQAAGALLRLDPIVTAEALVRGIAVKAAIVADDPKESRGVRERLNVGHTVAHALEAAEGFGGLLHGEAVAVGLVWETALAVELGRASPALLTEVVRLVRAFGLPATPAEAAAAGLLRRAADAAAWATFMRYDKKNRGRGVRFALLSAPGAVALVDVSPEALTDALAAALRRAEEAARAIPAPEGAVRLAPPHGGPDAAVDGTPLGSGSEPATGRMSTGGSPDAAAGRTPAAGPGSPAGASAERAPAGPVAEEEG
ncbi:MAG: 3-dehydroquinate synthase [Hydrogenibacillus schlegelii]|uniref:3-dehydroquinate synthase n=1 Tax=Hydrogenibacillus schlegelii TaxID=1484 RepID=A0A2T5GCX7_HYDSH|nr:3-dehydroquinate synthase [Hydrogenibacillus schlegelii]PTQ54030.1 MAG: 3-dehydroquinate synthase [Hydrogenibacillus schlegelii]